MQSAIRLQCKSCGGNLTIDPQREVLICPFCGSEELITDSDAVAVEKIRQKTTFKPYLHYHVVGLIFPLAKSVLSSQV